MKDTKRVFNNFSFYDFDGITAHMEKMAAEGWMLTQNNNRRWIYKRCEPKKVKFAVTYFPKASDFDPQPTEELQAFNEFCESAGWKPVANFAQMQIFYNENPDPVPIETDPMLQVKTIHSAMKKNFIPSYLIMILLSVFIVGVHVNMFMVNPINMLADASRFFPVIIYMMLTFISFVDLVKYLRWRKKAMAAAESGISIPSEKTPKLINIIAAAVAEILLVVYCASQFGKIKIWFMMLLFVIFGSTGLLGLFIKEFLKKKGASRKTNMALSLSIPVVVTLGIVFGLTMHIINSDISISHRESQPVGTYEKNNYTFDIYADPVPLKIEDFMAVDYDKYSYHNRTDSSVFISKSEVRQDTTINGTGVPEIRYTVIQVKMPCLYNFCFDYVYDEMTYDYDEEILAQLPELKETAVEIDPKEWNADKVYQLFREGEYADHYIICIDDIIFELNLYGDIQLTNSQKQIIGNKIKAI